MNLKRYASLKKESENWLPEIPSHWNVAPIWSLFARHKLTGFKNEQLLSVYRDYGVIPKNSRKDNFNKASEDLSSYQLVDVDDLVINKMKAWQGSVAISKERGIVSPAYHVYTPLHNENSRYLHYLFRSREYIVGYLANSKGIRVNQWDLEPQLHSRMKVLLPPTTEQQKIAQFLDYETAKIDALIDEQKRLIELLKEKRQAVISHAVTKGLNPDVPMKDSGVEWLGEVPEHWEVTKVSWVCDFISYGFTNPMPATDSGPYMLTATDIDAGNINYKTARKTSLHAFQTLLSPKSKPVKGDILLTKDGTLGRVAVFKGEQEVCISQSIALLRLNMKKVLPEFLSFAFMSSDYQEKIIFDAGGTTIKHIYISTLSKMPLTLPEPEEQQEIVKTLTQKLRRTDMLIEEAETASSLLKERRSALISAAVTGKIDVRDWQPPEDADLIDSNAAVQMERQDG